MARVDLLDSFPPELDPLVGRIRAGRRGELLKLYKALLHSPALAETWFEHMGAVRWRTQLEGRLRELAIIRVAYLCRVDYVLRQHIPKLAEADGVTAAECEALAAWQDSPLFDARERALLAYVDAMTRDIEVPDEIVAGLRAHFSQRQLVELTVLVAAYNMHARFVRALRIEPEE
jgi:4-carboxymuconolactone decarboxylase